MAMISISDAQKHGIPLPPVSGSNDQPSNANLPPEPPQTGEPCEIRYTLEQAFDYFYDPSNNSAGFYERLNCERAIRAVGFLLHFTSNHGNDDVNGWTAHGLGHALELIADKAAFYFHKEGRLPGHE